MIIFNLHYRGELAGTGALTRLQPGQFRYFVYGVIILLLSVLIHFNLDYLKKYVYNYRAEIRLVKKTGGDYRYFQLPLLTIIGVLETASILLAWLLSYILCLVVAGKQPGVVLTPDRFRFTLLMLLMTAGLGIGILTFFQLNILSPDRNSN